MPTPHPRHSITETPALRAALEKVRQRLGSDAPTLAELVARGAEVTLAELDARDRARGKFLETFVDRMRAAPEPDLAEIREIGHADRRSWSRGPDETFPSSTRTSCRCWRSVIGPNVAPPICNDSSAPLGSLP